MLSSLIWLLLVIGWHSQTGSAREERPPALYRHGFISADTGCFDLRPGGPMSAMDSALVKRVGLVRADTTLFGDYWPHARRLIPGKGLGSIYMLNAWLSDSLSDSVWWRFAHAYGSVGFELTRWGSSFSGIAYRQGDVPVDSLMGRVLAIRAACAETQR